MRSQKRLPVNSIINAQNINTTYKVHEIIYLSKSLLESAYLLANESSKKYNAKIIEIANDTIEIILKTTTQRLNLLSYP